MWYSHTSTDNWKASLAQSVERAAFNRKVVGSSPTGSVFIKTYKGKERRKRKRKKRERRERGREKEKEEKEKEEKENLCTKQSKVE